MMQPLTRMKNVLVGQKADFLGKTMVLIALVACLMTGGAIAAEGGEQIGL